MGRHNGQTQPRGHGSTTRNPQTPKGYDQRSTPRSGQQKSNGKNAK